MLKNNLTASHTDYKIIDSNDKIIGYRKQLDKIGFSLPPYLTTLSPNIFTA